MEKLKNFKEGELKVVDYILEDVFSTLDGDYSDYKEGDLVKYKVRLDWFDMWCSGIEVEKLMEEVSNNELWEDFKIIINNIINNDIWELDVKRSVVDGKYEDGEVYEVSWVYKEIL